MGNFGSNDYHAVMESILYDELDEWNQSIVGRLLYLKMRDAKIERT